MTRRELFKRFLLLATAAMLPPVLRGLASENMVPVGPLYLTVVGNDRTGRELRESVAVGQTTSQAFSTIHYVVSDNGHSRIFMRYHPNPRIVKLTYYGPARSG